MKELNGRNIKTVGIKMGIFMSGGIRFRTKISLFLVLGIGWMVFVLYQSAELFLSGREKSKLTALYGLWLLVPAVLIIVVDRFAVGKFGAKKVNEVQFFILVAAVIISVFNRYLR
ncbi:hypothetical protein [Sphingobacterium sp. BIGb0165]|uniref:hypothetical protein n=1 Tax=Sphingobacterium sp. BIGb0165 TaxID=2940615 RepID=UPI0021680557|nr:hypothetical protein [Sphingobacterium sp. BIGb0165]MCS4227308.1 hypothetical protein [Sphingobacterium sp. BIGb0165]